MNAADKYFTIIIFACALVWAVYHICWIVHCIRKDERNNLSEAIMGLLGSPMAIFPLTMLCFVLFLYLLTDWLPNAVFRIKYKLTSKANNR